MDHAVKEPEDGHDPPILPPHPSRHRAGPIRPSSASHAYDGGNRTGDLEDEAHDHEDDDPHAARKLHRKAEEPADPSSFRIRSGRAEPRDGTGRARSDGAAGSQVVGGLIARLGGGALVFLALRRLLDDLPLDGWLRGDAPSTPSSASLLLRGASLRTSRTWAACATNPGTHDRTGTGRAGGTLPPAASPRPRRTAHASSPRNPPFPPARSRTRRRTRGTASRRRESRPGSSSTSPCPSRTRRRTSGTTSRPRG